MLQTINIHPTRPLLILQVASSPQSVLSRRSLRNLNQLYYVNGPLRQYNSLKWNRTAVKNRTEDLLSLLRIWQTSDTFSSGDGSKYQRPLLTCRSSASSRTGNEPSQVDWDEPFGLHRIWKLPVSYEFCAGIPISHLLTLFFLGARLA